MCCEKYFTALTSTTHQNYFQTKVQYQLAYKKWKTFNLYLVSGSHTERRAILHIFTFGFCLFFLFKTWWYHGYCSLISVESKRPVWTVLTYETCGRTMLWIKFKVHRASRPLMSTREEKCLVTTQFLACFNSLISARLECHVELT